MSVHIYIIEPTVEHPATDVYVGSTKNTLGVRFSQHKYELNCSSKILFEKYGVENCRIRELECCDLENRFVREDHWIKTMSGVNQKASAFDKVEYLRKYYEENRERINESSRKYQKEHRERINECHRKRYEENREKRSESSRKYYEVNRERCNETHHKYYEANKDKINERRRERRAAKKISVDIINAVIEHIFLSTTDEASQNKSVQNPSCESGTV